MFHPSCIFWTKMSYLTQCGIRKCTTRFETDFYTSPHLISQSLATILIGSEVINPRVWNSFGGATFGQTHVICTLPSSLLKSHSKIKIWFEETLLLVWSSSLSLLFSLLRRIRLKNYSRTFVSWYLSENEWNWDGMARSLERQQQSSTSRFSKSYEWEIWGNLDPIAIIGFLTLPVSCNTVHSVLRNKSGKKMKILRVAQA